MVQYTAVRDLLHDTFPESANKTSRACQRRLNYMLKNQSSADNVALFLEDARQDQAVVDRFLLSPPEQEVRQEHEVRLEKDFGPLVLLLLAKYRKGGGQERLVLPATRQEVEQQYSLVFPSTAAVGRRQEGFQEPTSREQVQAAVLNSLITSSLCSASDKKSWAFQLYKIYQQYPDTLLRRVMQGLRELKMVSLKKHYNKTKVKEGNYLPLSSAPYQLSVTFSHTFLSRYQYDIYSQAWALNSRLLKKPGHFQEIVIGQEGGWAAAVVEAVATGRITFRVEVRIS